MEIDLKLTMIEAQDCEGELTKLTFQTTILDKNYHCEIILCDPASYTSSLWKGVGRSLSQACDELNKKLEKHLKK